MNIEKSPVGAAKADARSSIGGNAGAAILIPSCDAYSDLWGPFFALFRRHWPDCPFRVYLGSNGIKCAEPRVVTVKSGPSLVWGDCCLAYLSQIPEPIILFCLEDFFLRRKVNTQAIMTALDDFIRLDAQVFRLVRRPGPRVLLPGAYYGRIEAGDAYRICTQAAFWRKDFLRQMIRPGESAWDFEMKGSLRSDLPGDGFFGVQRDLLPYRHHVVERGKWFPWDAWNFGRQDIGCDFTRRKIMTTRECIHWLVRKTTSMALGVMPVPVRNALVAAVRRIKGNIL